MSNKLKNVAALLQSQLKCRALSSTPAAYSKEWRVAQGLSCNRTAEGILTDTPDYTYLDGRPTPLLQKQKKRMLQQREYASKIVELCSELDFAKERYHNMEMAKKQERQNIIDNRLKPKGIALKQKK